MLAIIVTGIISIIFIVLAVIANNKYWDFETLLASLAVLSTGVFMFISISLINKKRDFEEIKYQYEYTSKVLDSYHGFEYGNTVNLTQEMINMNNTIARHKAFYDSAWVGVWYSEEIGNLTPLTFKDFDI